MDLADAARRTLQEPSARLHEHSWFEPSRLPEFRHDGVTDIPRRRTHVDNGERGPRERQRLYAGTMSFDWWHDHWVVEDEGDVDAPERARNDPLWIVERLARSDARGPVFKLPPLSGEAWLDDRGRIARLLWVQARPHRPRSPLPWILKASLWHELELTDYGLPVDIELPDARRRSDPSVLGQVGIGLPIAIWTLYGAPGAGLRDDDRDVVCRRRVPRPRRAR